MPETQDLPDLIDTVAQRMRDRLGAGGGTLARGLAKSGHRLPRRVRAAARRLAEAEPLARHPRLRLTLNSGELGAAAREVTRHLDAIDLADRRKGWWLGMAAGMAFNLLLMVALLVAFLRWQGLI